MSIKKYLRQIYNNLRGKAVLENVFESNYEKNCLLLYVKKPFETSEESAAHQNLWQTKEIARLINGLGYNVDVVDYSDDIVWLHKKYDAVFDICVRDNPIYEKALKKNAKKIVYFTGSESVFANNAELKRIDDLYVRRGVKLQPRRQAPLISKRVEEFDEAIIIGNDYNLATYNDFRLPKTFEVPNTGYDLSVHFDRDKKKTNSFLYFGSAGSVHKGLDLLLEIFAGKDFPCKLYVCGNIKGEADFCKAYEQELYHTPNIKLVGFVDVLGEEFQKLYDECAYSLMPSCSEGRAGTVATCMSAGLIPICSRECGYEENEVITLQNCSKETIQKAILDASQQDMNWIETKSNEMIALSKTKYSRNAFTQEMGKALRDVL